jgi:hypothetical protein
MSLKSAFLASIKNNEKIYSNLPTISFTNDEFEVIREKISKEKIGSQVPPLRFPQ